MNPVRNSSWSRGIGNSCVNFVGLNSLFRSSFFQVFAFFSSSCDAEEAVFTDRGGQSLLHQHRSSLFIISAGSRASAVLLWKWREMAWSGVKPGGHSAPQSALSVFGFSSENGWRTRPHFCGADFSAQILRASCIFTRLFFLELPSSFLRRVFLWHMHFREGLTS